MPASCRFGSLALIESMLGLLRMAGPERGQLPGQRVDLAGDTFQALHRVADFVRYHMGVPV
jgi:hypothetical protein